MIQHLTGWKLRAALFSALTLAFTLFCWGIPLLFAGMSRVVPENYSFLAKEAMAKDRPDRAITILQGRINREFYDFSAHYLLAEAQAQAKLWEDAAETMRSVVPKSLAIRGRFRPEQAGYAGFDEAKTVQLLARYLYQAGHAFSAGETYRHAMDLGSSVAYDDVKALPAPDSTFGIQQALAIGNLAIRLNLSKTHGQAVSRLAETGPAGQSLAAYLRARWMAEMAKDTTAALTTLKTAATQDPQNIIPALALQVLTSQYKINDPETNQIINERLAANIARQAPLNRFVLPVGTTLDAGTLRFTRRGSATVETDTGMFRSEYLVVAYDATPAFGQWPLVVLRIGKKEVARLYLDSPQPGIRIIGPFPGGLPKLLELTIEYTNDAFDPITKSDRDVRIRGIWFQ